MAMIYSLKKSFTLILILLIIILFFTLQKLRDIEQNKRQQNDIDGTNKGMEPPCKERNNKINADEIYVVKSLAKSSSSKASGNQTEEKVHSSSASKYSPKRWWRFYETLRLKRENSPVTFVLLITYGRSGSSWLGDMTSQANSTFYVFEPLQRIVSQGYFKENFVCFNNNTCRRPRKLVETHTAILTTLYKLFSCQMSTLLPFFKSRLQHNLRSKSHIIALKQCRSQNSSTLNSCLKELESICASTTHRVLKTIRISMELVDILMNIWPNLKIVHLIRDPRAITHSRLRSLEFSMAQNILTHSQDLCTRMYDDVVQHMKLRKLFRNRLRLVLYEALIDTPLDGAVYIYKFLNMTLTEDVIQWIYYTTHANKTASSHYFGTLRSNATKVAWSWRVKMDFVKVQVIDYFCRDLYSLVGLVPMNSTKELKSLMVPARRKSSIDGFM